MPAGAPDEDFVDNLMVMEAMGAAGWELVIIYQGYMIFKRHAQA